MKKLLVMIMMLLLFVSSKAPGLNDIERESLYNRLWTEHLRLKYEVEFDRFINHLGFKESSNNWMAINSIGCIGEWQFSKSTLRHFGYGHITLKSFRADPSIFPREIQFAVLKDLLQFNSTKLQEYECFIGTAINGVIITKAGLLAGSHLGGFGSVKLYLNSVGRIDKKDANGTKISDYIREFSLYNL